MIEFIKNNLFNKNDKLCSARLNFNWFNKNGYDKYYYRIFKLTKFLKENSILSERIYCIVNNINSLQICPVCNENPLTFRKYSVGYDTYCSQLCANKIKFNKFKKTCIEKYGVDNPSKVRKIKEKKTLTALKNYGVDNPMKADCVIDRVKRTNLKKYGVEWSLQSDKIKQKSIKTSLKKYGVKQPAQSDRVKQKIILTNQLKYGNNSYTQQHIFNIDDINREFISKHFLDDNNYLKRDEFQYHFNCSLSTMYKILQKLNIKHKMTNSFIEDEIYDFVSSYDDVLRNDRTIIKPYEIDIVIPKRKIAIEFNGLHWHSEQQGKDKNYHLNKTLLCRKKGIRLFHIFENEWTDAFKREVWKSVILSNLGYNKRIFARKTEIREVNTNDKNVFLDNNHLQGKCQSSKNFGLYYNNELVSLITFNKSRFNRNFKWELVRYCNKKNFTVVGGFSKLLKHFERLYKGSIVTYADLRYSEGGLYKKTGFTKGIVNKPSYFYFKGHTVLSRMQCQKSKLSKLLDCYDKNLTEKQNMLNNGYEIIWNCGTIQFYK